MVNKKAPELRFKGFTEDWELCKLGDEVSVTMGQSPNGKNYTENPNDNILVQGNADMQKGKVVPRVWTTQITKTAEPGDIILSVRAPVGDVGKTDFNVVLGRGVAGIKGNDYIYQYLIRMKEIGYWTRVSTGSTFESINSNDLRDAVINSPSQNEQYKIGEFFFKLDKTITLHQRKLDQLNRVKQVFLQNIFLSSGKKLPTVRFANFKNKWEQRKLGETSDVRDGTHESPKYIDEGFPLVTSKNLKSYGLDLSEVSLISYKDFESINTRSKVDIGDILFGMIGTIGNPVLVNREDFAIKNVALIKENQNVINTFLIQLLKSPVFEKYIAKENTGGTQKFLSLKKIRNFEFLYPCLDEQNKISTFFIQIDKAITLHQQKLDKLNQLKSAYLQKMFV